MWYCWHIWHGSLLPWLDEMRDLTVEQSQTPTWSQYAGASLWCLYRNVEHGPWCLYCSPTTLFLRRPLLFSYYSVSLRTSPALLAQCSSQNFSFSLNVPRRTVPAFLSHRSSSVLISHWSLWILFCSLSTLLIKVTPQILYFKKNIYIFELHKCIRIFTKNKYFSRVTEWGYSFLSCLM